MHELERLLLVLAQVLLLYVREQDEPEPVQAPELVQAPEPVQFSAESFRDSLAGSIEFCTTPELCHGCG